MTLQVSKPRFANPEQTIINCTLTVDGQALPFTASPDDPEERGQEIFFAAASGEYGPIAGYQAPLVPAPTAEVVDAERDRRIAAGITFEVGGQAVRFQSRSQDIENVLGGSTLALAAIMNGAQPGDYLWHQPEDGVTPFLWIAEDNSLHIFDAQTFFAFGQALARHKSFHIFKGRALKDSAPIPSNYQADEHWQ